ncbi:MAG: IgGFc-binding protein [Myxococcales bacterium]|nr:IgGFc-binding protein [Myxococcales bacterium]
MRLNRYQPRREEEDFVNRQRFFVTVCAVLIWTGAACSEDKKEEDNSGFGASGNSDTGILGESDGSGGFGGTGESDTAGAQNGDSSSVAQDADSAETFGCIPGSNGGCFDSASRKICNVDGTDFVAEACPDGTACTAGQCLNPTCTPGEPKNECASTTAYLVCNAAGTLYESVSCPNGLKCNQGKCEDLFCVPDTSVCFSPTSIKKCLSDGSAYGQPELCPQGQQCNGELGQCVDACDANTKAGIYVGCNYFALDLDNVEGGATAEVAVVVSVPATEDKDATITVRDMSNGLELTAEQMAVDSLKIAPGGLKVFLMPADGTQGANPLDGSIKTKASYEIKSTAPVTVHQFNPLNGEGVFTNDASLLLPSNLGGTEYLVMGWPHRIFQDDDQTIPFRGFVTIVATEVGTTQVVVTARGQVAGGKGVPSIKKNQTHMFTLEQGEVLNLETDGDEGEDLTGSWIKTDKKVNVLAGSECANIPVGVDYCDHIEQQLIPVNTWGSSYVADAFIARNEHQFDIWRVMGGRDNTTVTTNPPIKGFEVFTLHKGTFVEFIAKGTFAINADGPILVGHYMVGSNYPGYQPKCESGSGIGDPAFTLAVPVEQQLLSYVVLTPPGYAENYINVVSETGVDVSIDDVPITNFSPIGTTGFQIAHVPVQTGVHSIVGAQKFGVTAYGYDCDVSYAYPGGLKLTTVK